MNRDFNAKFDKMLDNDPSGRENRTGVENENYPQEGYGRNLAFRLADGSRLFLSYSYLVACEYKPEDGVIELEFTTRLIRLKGIRLEELFDALMSQVPRNIVCRNDRYEALSDQKEILVTEIEVSKND